MQKAFTEINKTKSGYIQYDEFLDLIKQWGFEADEYLVRSLFDWLDHDKDNKVSFEDLRSTAGKEIAPMEQLFFRQDVKPGKPVTCKYENCWEDNKFNSKSAYCLLH